MQMCTHKYAISRERTSVCYKGLIWSQLSHLNVSERRAKGKFKRNPSKGKYRSIKELMVLSLLKSSPKVMITCCIQVTIIKQNYGNVADVGDQ